MSKDLEHSFFKNLVDIIPDPLIVIEKKNLIIKYLNQECEVFFDKSKIYLINNSLLNLFKDDSYFISSLNKLISRTGTFVIKKTPLKYGKFVDIKCIFPEIYKNYFFLIFKKDGNSIYEELFDEKKFNILDESLSILVHEINNPLSSIKLATQLLDKNISDDNKELIDIINKETSRIIEYIEKLSIYNTDFVINKKKPENIHELIRYSLFKLKLRSKKIKIIENFDPSLPLVSVEKNLLIQVLENLFLNAYEASKFIKSSYIKVSTNFLFGHTIKIPNLKENYKKNSLMITIEDNGKGIDKKKINNIFLPFFTTKKKGSGIGLYVVKKIINQHGGNVKIVQNENKFIVMIQIPI